MQEKKKIFSIPLNPFITKEDYENIFIPFVNEYKDWIYDIYFTLRLPPFTQDAMGAVLTEEQMLHAFNNAIDLQEKTGVTVSGTFNNINVPATMENLSIFIKNLKYVTERGLRSMTMPHLHWMLTGELKKNFPNLLVKNTVLRKVKTAQEFWNHAQAGFDYVNIDRALLRDLEALKQIKKAQMKFFEKTGRYVQTAILANEGCRGNCPVMDEHYNINNSSGSKQPGTDKPYFYQPISSVSCSKWRVEDPAYEFKIANIPPFREDVEEILEYVDILKMHGREGAALLNDTIKFIKSYVSGATELHDISVRNKLTYLNVPEGLVNSWRKHIKNCQFECWNCEMCDELVKNAQIKHDREVDMFSDDYLESYMANLNTSK